MIYTELTQKALRHNSDVSRLDIVDDRAIQRIKKYKKAIALLTE